MEFGVGGWGWGQGMSGMSDPSLYLGEVVGEELGTVVKSSSSLGCFRQTGR